jgi:hypothetical protein
MSSGPSSAEVEGFLGLVRTLRADGAVRVSWGLYAVDFAEPPAAAVLEPERVAIDPLSRAEREELAELRELKQMAEELGHG